MKKTMLMIILASTAFAEEPIPTNGVDYVEGEKSTALVTPQIQAIAGQMFGQPEGAAFLHAMFLNMNKYDMDMRTPEGRKRWHGTLVGTSVPDTNNWTIVETYSNEVNGAVWKHRRRCGHTKGRAFVNAMSAEERAMRRAKIEAEKKRHEEERIAKIPAQIRALVKQYNRLAAPTNITIIFSSEK